MFSMNFSDTCYEPSVSALSTSSDLSFAEDIPSHQQLLNWQEERRRGKCSCLKEKEKGRKATMRLNYRRVLKPLPKRGSTKKKKNQL